MARRAEGSGGVLGLRGRRGGREVESGGRCFTGMRMLLGLAPRIRTSGSG
jgi:hypothetical protein